MNEFKPRRDRLPSGTIDHVRSVFTGDLGPRKLFLFMKCVVYPTEAVSVVAADVDMFGEGSGVAKIMRIAAGRSQKQARPRQEGLDPA